MSEREWWQDDSDDLIDAERLRAAEILAACIKARRPCLALRWIALGTSLSDVMGVLIAMLATENDGSEATTLSSEFETGVHVFAGLEISRHHYCAMRRAERKLVNRCGG